MSRHPSPFGDQNVSQQLDSWASVLEKAVAELTKTLGEVRELQQKGNDDDDGSGEHGGGPGGGGDDR